MQPTHVNSLLDPEQQIAADISTLRFDRKMAENKRIGLAKRRASERARTAPVTLERRGMSDYQKLVKMYGSVAEAEKRIAQYIADKREAMALPSPELIAARDRRLRFIQTIL